MSGMKRRRHRPLRASRDGSTAQRIFGTMAAAGAIAYLRARDLPKLVAPWPHELDDQTPEGALRILAKLRRALRAERRRGLSGHWSYDLNRHLDLLSAYKGELAGLRLGRSELQPYCTRRGAKERGCG